jgi:hypothetical protein
MNQDSQICLLFKQPSLISTNSHRLSYSANIVLAAIIRRIAPESQRRCVLEHVSITSMTALGRVPQKSYLRTILSYWMCLAVFV